uniref:Uncharacterized protein n=1 Tax=Romanomermis culicivorax TaxID=13658 RepID=A0A915IWG4_ROMCU
MKCPPTKTTGRFDSKNETTLKLIDIFKAQYEYVFRNTMAKKRGDSVAKCSLHKKPPPVRFFAVEPGTSNDVIDGDRLLTVPVAGSSAPNDEPTEAVPASVQTEKVIWSLTWAPSHMMPQNFFFVLVATNEHVAIKIQSDLCTDLGAIL